MPSENRCRAAIGVLHQHHSEPSVFVSLALDRAQLGLLELQSKLSAVKCRGDCSVSGHPQIGRVRGVTCVYHLCLWLMLWLPEGASGT